MPPPIGLGRIRAGGAACCREPDRDCDRGDALGPVRPARVRIEGLYFRQHCAIQLSPTHEVFQSFLLLAGHMGTLAPRMKF